jgi:hypothetical protein
MHTPGKPSQHGGSADHQKRSSMALRRGTGPRTPIGKQRTKYNALKHGLFAKAVLLSHESQSQFDDLVCDLKRDLMPKGMLDELLVEKIATIVWRYRRLLQAESANVQENIEAQEDHNAGFSRESLRIQASLEKVTAGTDRRGALPEIDDPESLEYCLDKLVTVREHADRFGLDYRTHSVNLGLVYGARYSGRPGKDLFDYYLECLCALNAPAAERESRGFESEVDCVQKFIAEGEKEIHRLEVHRKRPVQEGKALPLTDDDQPRGMELLELAIPDSDHLDRLLRYEANLERALDRVLIQLERLQRMRDSQKTIELAHQTAASD